MFFVLDFGGNMGRRYSVGNKETHELRVNIVTETVLYCTCSANRTGTAICCRTSLTLSSCWLVILKQQIFKTNFKRSSERVLFRVKTDKLHFHFNVIYLFLPTYFHESSVLSLTLIVLMWRIG